MSVIISETWVDEYGWDRHSNCQGLACKVLNCRQSRVAERDPSKANSLPDTFTVQVVKERLDTHSDNC
jgi:hypothetical protein